MLHVLQSVFFTFVLAGGLPSSYFRFFRMAFFLPPVERLLCQLSREIPIPKRNILVMAGNHYPCQKTTGGHKTWGLHKLDSPVTEPLFENLQMRSAAKIAIVALS